MNIKEITITQRASLNYQVSEHSITFELHDGDDERECTQYISSLAMNDAINDVKALAKALPDAHPAQAKPQVSTTVNNNRRSYTPQGQYRKVPYHQQNGQLSGPKPVSEAQRAFYRQLAEQVGNTAPCPSTSYECAQAIQMMKNDIGLN